jgi:hypothetical protein
LFFILFSRRSMLILLNPSRIPHGQRLLHIPHNHLSTGMGKQQITAKAVSQLTRQALFQPAPFSCNRFHEKPLLVANTSARTCHRVGRITARMVGLHVIGTHITPRIYEFYLVRGKQTVGAYEVGNYVRVC